MPAHSRKTSLGSQVGPKLREKTVGNQPHFFDWRFFASLCVLIGVSVGFAAFSRVSGADQSDNANQARGLFGHLSSLVSNQDEPLKGETGDRINLLLLGIGGPGHDGAYLADTIILVSLKPSTGQLAMLSIPRDLYVPIPNHNWRKINNANAFGLEDKYPGGGEQLTADIISDIFDQPIQYFARIDFAGFEQIVDDLGGVNVNVEQSFIDNQYPTDDYGYQTIRFQAGRQTMDGARALQYVRSRKTTSDFDRSRRQQQVLVAIRDRALSFGTLLNPIRITDVLTDLGNHTKTNLEVWEMLRLAELVERLTVGQIINRVLDNGGDGPLKSETTIDGAFILRPKAGPDDWSELRQIAADIFEVSDIVREEATIVIQNGSGRPGLADQTASALSQLGFTVLRTETAKYDVESTTIFDLSGGQRPRTLASLKQQLPSVRVRSTLPLSLDPDSVPNAELDSSQVTRVRLSATKTRPDFLIVLGSADGAAGLLDVKSVRQP